LIVGASLTDINSDLNRTLVIGSAKKTEIIEQIAKDTQMLASLNIMDYSLLIGIHKRNSQSFEVVPDLSNSNGNVEIDCDGTKTINQQPNFSLCAELLPREINFSEPESFVAEPDPDDSFDQVLSTDGSEIYFFSIIDITQRYGLTLNLSFVDLSLLEVHIYSRFWKEDGKVL